MSTLLQLYELHANGNKKDFFNEVEAYGLYDFASDLQVEIHDDVLTYQEAFKMLTTIVCHSELRGK